MNDGLIPKRYAKALYKLAVENGDSHEIYEQLKPMLRGLKGLDDIKRYREEHDIAKVDILSAAELPKEQAEAIVNIVRERMPGTTLEVEYLVAPELIGGFIVRVGDVLLDASVKNELKNLRLKLLS